MSIAKIVNKLVIIVYLLCSVAISVYYFRSGDVMGVVLGPVSLLFLLIPPVAERLFRMVLPTQIRTYIYAFVIFAFHFGVALEFYDKIGAFDIIAHVLSGIIFTAIGLCFFSVMSGHPVSGNALKWFIPLTYAFFFSMFVAVFWEIGEFIGYLLTGNDMQHHLDTGVFDTMEDLISCVIGSMILSADYLLYIKKGFRFIFATSVEPFENANHLSSR